MDVAIRPPTCSLPVIFLGDLEETCILCFSRRFCSHVNCECVMSRGLIPSFHQNLPSRMWFSPRPQSKPRSHSGNGRGGCEPYASAFLTSSCILHSPSLRQSSPAPPDLPDQFDCMSTGNLAVSPLRREAASSPEARHGMAGHGRVWQTDRVRFATWLHLPRFQTPARVESPAAWHSFSCRYDISCLLVAPYEVGLVGK